MNQLNNNHNMSHLLESLNVDDDEISALTRKVERISFNATYISLAKLTFKSPYLQEARNNEGNTFSQKVLEEFKESVPDISVVVRNARVAASILFFSVLGVVLASCLGYFLSPVQEVWGLVITAGFALSLILTVLSAFIFLHLRGIESSFYKLSMRCALEHSAIATSKYELLRSDVDSLIADPAPLFEDRDSINVSSMQSSLDRHFRGYAA